MRDVALQQTLPRLVLIRGLPGSGKTTMAQDYLNQGYLHVEADQFFMVDGEYRFDVEKLKEAHEWCLSQTCEALAAGEFVCVANVFATTEDIRPYTELCDDYQVKEAAHAGQSIHKVPTATLRAMESKWVPTAQIEMVLRIKVHSTANAVSANTSLPNLTFPMMEYGRTETPWDLRVLLYKGGARGNPKTVFNQIAAGELGRPLIKRLELVKRIHEEMTARLVGGGSKQSAFRTLIVFRYFFRWCDEFDKSLSLNAVESTYRQWCDFLVNCQRLNAIRKSTAYHYASIASSILGAALDRTQPLILTSRIRYPKSSPRAVGVAGDKQNLADTFAFGHLCLDVIDSLSFSAIYGPLPVEIRLRDGQMIEQWSGLIDPKKLAVFQPGYQFKALINRALRNRADLELNRSLRTRYPLVNLRLMAELMLFIGQTGMNLSQAHNLRLTQYSYKSTIDGYEVRDYKARRKGEVLFEIFTDYKDVFEDYLVWRAKIFGTASDRLFPFVRTGGAKETTPTDFKRFRSDICEAMGVPFVGPQKLRNTRVNWLLRESRDPDLTAEMAQHLKQTLLRIYEKPSLQVAMREIIQFHQKNDPRLVGDIMTCPAPGECDGVPESFPDLPPEAPKPDCTHPAGCLFCGHHRDIDSEDYVWSTASMRHLNTIILRRFRPQAKGKADPARHVEMAVDVLTAKLTWFKDSNTTRKAWVDEAMEKLAEGDFHAHWRYLIESAEGV